MTTEKLYKNVLYGIQEGHGVYMSEIYDFSNKMEIYRKNDMQLLKDTLRSVLKASSTEASAEYRYKHSMAVAQISENLAFGMSKKESPLIQSSEQLLAFDIFNTNNLWMFSMLGLLHDMYKYAETSKVNHGKIASKQFALYCKTASVDMSGIVLQMKEALLFHSNKDMVIKPNLFFAVLCDADILSDITPFTMERYMQKYKLSQKDALDKIITDVSKYVPKTRPEVFINEKEALMNKLALRMRAKRWLD